MKQAAKLSQYSSETSADFQWIARRYRKLRIFATGSHFLIYGVVNPTTNCSMLDLRTSRRWYEEFHPMEYITIQCVESQEMFRKNIAFIFRLEE
jgi:hypothetical protein